jgi:hypothetical protein
VNIQQKKLAAEQVEAFHHDQFVDDQVRDFAALLNPIGIDGPVLDIGGGCGFFARSVNSHLGLDVHVLDSDPDSVAICRKNGVRASLGDAFDPTGMSGHQTVSFNLILHHLVGSDERETRKLQMQALSVWRRSPVRIFVNEYIYQSFVGNISGRLIYEITSSRVLSAVGGFFAKFIPAFRANTFGVGVRFRSHDEWLSLFDQAGFRIAGSRIGNAEPVSPFLRLLAIKSIRRDSFLLEALT